MADNESDDVFEAEESPHEKAAKRSPGSRSSRSGLLIVGGVFLGLLLVCGGILMLPKVQGARNAARYFQNKNNLKQIGLALHNYHDVYKMFPPGGIVREDGMQLLSWQASILPYLDGAGAPLFANINPDFAWNSPQNQSPFSQQIDTYLNPGVSRHPDGAVSHHAGNSHLFQFNKGVSIAEITDGTSNTILAGNVSTGFKLWGDPTNVRDPGLGIGNTPEQFGGPFQGGAHFLLADGSVRFIRENIDRNVLKALATPAGGEQVGEF